MSASLTASISTAEIRPLIVGTAKVMASGTARAVRIALKEGADYARKNHPHQNRTGRLVSSAELFGEMRQANDSGAWGYLTNKTPYARIIEFGSKAHTIYPKAGHGMVGPVRDGQTRRATGRGPHEHVVGRGLALRFRVGGRIVFAKSVSHPGTPALSFMRPAAEYAGEVVERETESFTFARVADLWER
jgi:hypothetical protein